MYPPEEIILAEKNYIRQFRTLLSWRFLQMGYSESD
jgi:hypothetical protein